MNSFAKKFSTLLIVGSLIFPTSPSNAIMPVMDVGHTLQSYLNFLQLVQAEITRIKQLQNQIKQATNFTDISRWKGSQVQQFRALTGYIGSLENIYGSIGAQSGRLRTRLDQALISKMTYPEYIGFEQKMVQEGNQEAIRRHDDDLRVLRQTQKDSEEVQNWESQISPDITQKDSSLMMNQQLNKLVAQNSELLKVMAATRIEGREDSGADRARQIAADRALADRRQAYAKKILEAQEAARKGLPKSPLQ